MFIDYATATYHDHADRPRRDAFGVLLSARVFMVAEDRGVARDGPTASHAAIDGISDYYRSLEGFGPASLDTPPSARSRMVAALDLANEVVWAKNAHVDPLRRIRAAFVCAQFSSRSIVVGWVGDSRCYRWRRGELAPLTADHLLIDESRPFVSERELRALAPLQTIPTRGLGQAATLSAGVHDLEAEPGDVYLLASSGFSPVLESRETPAKVFQAACLRGSSETLVGSGRELGVTGTATALFVRVGWGRL